MSDPTRPADLAEPFAVELPPTPRPAPLALPLVIRNRLRAEAHRRCRPA